MAKNNFVCNDQAVHFTKEEDPVTGIKESAMTNLNKTGRTFLIVGSFGWIFIVTAIGAQGWFTSLPGVSHIILALGICTPVVMLLACYFGRGWFRSYADGIDLRLLIGMNLIRVATGTFYLVEYAQDRFPGGFAIPAGVGDITAALACIPLLHMIGEDTPHARSFFVGWNIFGLLDFIVGTAAGVLYSRSPFGLLSGVGPSTELLGRLPFCIIPTVALPVLFCLHLLLFHRLHEDGNRPCTLLAR